MSNLTITSSVRTVTPTETVTYGTEGKTFTKRTVVLEDSDEYNDCFVFELGGEQKCALADSIKEGDIITIHYNINCREYTNKKTGKIGYFTSLRGWKIEQNASISSSPSDAFVPNAAPSEEIPF